MVFVLPNADLGLPGLEGKLDGERLGGLLASLRAQRERVVDLKLPRFEMRTAVPLTTPLRELGMKRAFQPSAEFGAIADERLCVSDVVHQAFVRVDEKGAEAAAATAVILRKSAALPEAAVQLVLDRPFLFAIVERQSGMVLFFGRCAQP
jgi:serpin B